MNFSDTPEFRKELKKFNKRYYSLAGDISAFKIVVSAQQALNEALFFEGSRASKLVVTKTYEIVKARLDCAALGNKQLLRVIYIYDKTQESITFLQLYAKNEKSREDVVRIRRYRAVRDLGR